MSEIPYKPTQKPTLPRRPKNEDVRNREHLIPEEVDRLIAAAARTGRYGERDALMIRVAYRHGFRVSELIDLRWEDVDLKTASIQVKRKKGCEPSTQALSREEINGFRRLKGKQTTGLIFIGERGTISVDMFQKIVKRAGAVAQIGFPVHPHMLRHACGYAHAYNGTHAFELQQILGHKDIRNTIKYTKLAGKRVYDASKNI